MKKRFRGPAIEHAYQEYRTQHSNHMPFSDWQTRCIKEYSHWILIKNYFPWDTIADTHHLLIPRRIFTHETDMTEDERKDLIQIKQELHKTYDMFIENGNSCRSVMTHFHIHCIIVLEETDPIHLSSQSGTTPSS